MAQPSFNTLQIFAIEHMKKYHVSLGGAQKEGELFTPTGSGIFVQFSVFANQTVMKIYGIYTASHVAFEISQNLIIDKNGIPFIVLSKPINGQTLACLTNFYFIEHSVSKKEFCSYYKNIDKKYHAPDLSFIAISINNFPKHELFENSEFYDLDQRESLLDQALLSGFYRGACPDGDVKQDELTTTGPYLGGSEIKKIDQRYHLCYWKITSNQSCRGGSGAAFWQFDIKNEQIKAYLGGIITRQDGKYIYATCENYIYDKHLPNIKLLVTK